MDLIEETDDNEEVNKSRKLRKQFTKKSKILNLYQRDMCSSSSASQSTRRSIRITNRSIEAAKAVANAAKEARKFDQEILKHGKKSDNNSYLENNEEENKQQNNLSTKRPLFKVLLMFLFNLFEFCLYFC